MGPNTCQKCGSMPVVSSRRCARTPGTYQSVTRAASLAVHTWYGIGGIVFSLARTSGGLAGNKENTKSSGQDSGQVRSGQRSEQGSGQEGGKGASVVTHLQYVLLQ